MILIYCKRFLFIDEELTASIKSMMFESLSQPCWRFNNIIISINPESSMTETLSQAQKFTILRETTERYPLKCKLFINLLLSNLPQGQHIQTPKDFKKAFSSFSQIFTKQTT